MQIDKSRQKSQLDMEKHVVGIMMMNNGKNMVRESISKMKNGKAPGSSVFLYIYILICDLAAPWPTSGHCRGDSLVHPMLISLFSCSEGQRKPHNEIRSLSLTESLDFNCNVITD